MQMRRDQPNTRSVETEKWNTKNRGGKDAASSNDFTHYDYCHFPRFFRQKKNGEKRWLFGRPYSYLHSNISQLYPAAAAAVMCVRSNGVEYGSFGPPSFPRIFIPRKKGNNALFSVIPVNLLRLRVFITGTQKKKEKRKRN